MSYARANLKSLGLFGLVVFFPRCLGALTFSGETRFDGKWVLSQQTQDQSTVPEESQIADNLYISRARLQAQGQLFGLWQYVLRFQTPEQENTQIGIYPDVVETLIVIPELGDTPKRSVLPVEIAQAYVAYDSGDSVRFELGNIAAPDITSQRLGYEPYIGAWPSSHPVGSVVHHSGNHPGMRLMIGHGWLYADLGVWQQTPMRKYFFNNAVTYDPDPIRWGIGGRLNGSAPIKARGFIAAGLGYNSASLNMTVITAVDDGTDNLNSAFNTLNNLALDSTVIYDNWQINAGYQYQKTSEDSLYSSIVLTGSEPIEIMRGSGTATALWVEGGYMLHGARYALNKSCGALAGVVLREGRGAFEITARYGYEKRTNLLALLTPTGFRDFRSNQEGTAAEDNWGSILIANPYAEPNTYYTLVNLRNSNADIGYEITPDGSEAFTERMTGFSIGMNYHISKSMVLKSEYEHRHNEFKRLGGPTDWTGSLVDKNVGTLRLRADYLF